MFKGLFFLIICLYSSYSERRIKDGKIVTVDKPYMVYLVKAEKSDKAYDAWVCGGTIVTENFIITSAACVQDVQFMYAIAGYNKYVSHDKLANDSCTKEKKKKVIYVCVPKSYKLEYDKVEKWGFIDIAVVKVESPYNFKDETFKTQCSYIPKPIPINFEAKFQEPGTDVLALGWGHIDKYRKLTDKKNHNQEKLHYAATKIIKKDACKKEYDTTPKLHSIIDKYMICTQGMGNMNQSGDIIIPINGTLDGCKDGETNVDGICVLKPHLWNDTRTRFDYTRRRRNRNVKKNTEREPIYIDNDENNDDENDNGNDNNDDKDLKESKDNKPEPWNDNGNPNDDYYYESFEEEETPPPPPKIIRNNLHTRNKGKRNKPDHHTDGKLKIVITSKSAKMPLDGPTDTSPVPPSTDPSSVPPTDPSSVSPTDPGPTTPTDPGTTSPTDPSPAPPPATNTTESPWTGFQGICQNDHGGPLITWRGSHEILIGIASVYRVDKDLNCTGPFLFTSTQCNGLFIECVFSLMSERRSTSVCDTPAEERGFDISERQISWLGHPDGPSEGDMGISRTRPEDNEKEAEAMEYPNNDELNPIKAVEDNVEAPVEKDRDEGNDAELFDYLVKSQL